MKALCWHGAQDMRYEEVPDPTILQPRDVIVRVTSTTICGSDLHLYNNFIPAMLPGDIMGHEYMGEVVEVGGMVKNFKLGDRVVAPFCIACGSCFFCQRAQTSLCDNTNPKGQAAEALYGYGGAALYGYSHLLGGYAGGQAEYVRAPFADANLIKVPDGLDDDKALFLSDIYPTGWMAALNCDIKQGDTVAVWGCGPVGQFAIASAFLQGAERVIAIDRLDDRLRLARTASGAETINMEEAGAAGVYDQLRDLTGGRGPDSCIDAVGMEAHGLGLMGLYDKVKQRLMMESDRAHVLREAIRCCRKGGNLSVAGVYSGVVDKFPFGIAFGKGLTIKMGQTHVHAYSDQLLRSILDGKIDPSFIITHYADLADGPQAYDQFLHKQEECQKIVLRPGYGRPHHVGAGVALATA